MKNFLRRLVRFLNDPRYRVFSSRRPISPKEFWVALDARTLTHQVSVRANPKPEVRPFCTMAYLESCRELHPKLEWPDILGNGLFVIFCAWVLWRASVSPAGLWIAVLVLVVEAVMLVRLSIQLCQVAWRTWFSRHDGFCAASPDFRRFAPGGGLTRHPPYGGVCNRALENAISIIRKCLRRSRLQIDLGLALCASRRFNLLTR